MNRRELIAGAAALAACAPAASQAPAPFPMRRGVNLGNALEAPDEGDWGYRIEEAHLAAIADAGFDGVRLPVRWDAHAATEAPYAIASAFMARVRAVVEQALARGLKVQLDCHHYDALIANPSAHRARFLAIWTQIAREFRGAPAGLIFEPLNEPNGDWWRREHLSDFQREALDVIRTDHPERLVVLGPGNWNSVDGLTEWRPPQDPHIAVSVHYYEPHAFTHQNAEWLGAEAPNFGRAWGTEQDFRRIERDAEQAATWAAQNRMALQLGEFGVNVSVSLDQRIAWLGAVRQAFERRGIAWCVWDFAGAFAIWDRDARRFHPRLVGKLFDVLPVD